tara:strand:- start:2829 stop:3395 length:567 start_codon:yes stop_codon:yes gene_type:complete
VRTCSPAPSSGHGEAKFSWKNIKVRAKYGTETYKVCVNFGFTYDRYGWYEAGTFTVAGASYKYENYLSATTHNQIKATTPAKPTTPTSSTAWKVYIMGPFANGATAPSSAWRLKLIESHYDCNKVTLSSKFTVGGVAQDGAASGSFVVTRRRVRLINYKAGSGRILCKKKFKNEKELIEKKNEIERKS